MLPNMSSVLNSWEQTVIIKSVATTTTNFVPTETVTKRNQLCVIQPAKATEINPDTIDYKLKYITAHSKSIILIGEYITYEANDYKVIIKNDWQNYGYYEVIGEETKKTLLV